MFKNSGKNSLGNFKVYNSDKKKHAEFIINFEFKDIIESRFIRSNQLDTIELPEKNKSIFVITSKNRNPELFIKNVSNKNKINKLIIFASRTNKLISTPDLLISSQNNYNNHAKIIIINNYIIFGSGNFNNNARVEAYQIINSQILVDQLTNDIHNSIKGLITIPPKYIYLPKKGELSVILRHIDFSPLDIIKEVDNEKIIDLVICGYRISKKALKYVTDRYNCKFIMSDSIKFMTPDIYNLILRFDLSLINIHAKIILIKTMKNYYVVNSSNNIDSAKKIDFSTILNSEKLYKDIWAEVKGI